MRKLIQAFALAAGAVAVGTVMTVSADTTVVVTPADIGTTWFTADSRAAGTGTFENGPDTPPLGTGSFELVTTVDVDKVQLFTDQYDGTALADIDGIGYSTYRDPASTGNVSTVPSLNMRVDLDGGGTPDRYMVYEPYQDQGNAAVLTGEWQSWDAFAGGTARWWLSGSGACDQNNPCTWATILLLFPSATVREGPTCGPGNVVTPCPGSLGVNQGTFNSNTIGNVDALYVSVNGNKTTFNFELNPPPPPLVGPPTDKDQCKNGGWATFDLPFEFRNQGDCVSWVASQGKARPNR